jgi:hypothetical protein
MEKNFKFLWKNHVRDQPKFSIVSQSVWFISTKMGFDLIDEKVLNVRLKKFTAFFEEGIKLVKKYSRNSTLLSVCK